MKARNARLITYSVVGLLAIGALGLTPPISHRPDELFEPQLVASEPQWSERTDTLGRGETLSVLLARTGVTGTDAVEALTAAKTIDMRRLPAGMTVTTRSLEPDSVPTEIVFQLAIDRLLRVSKTDDGWVGEEQRLPWTTDTLAVAGSIRSTLYHALDEVAAMLPSGARSELAWTVADIFEYRVDMSRDLRADDAFRVLFERSVGPNGAVRIGKVLAATFELSGTTSEAIRFESASARGDYFDQDGKSMRAAFLRAPLAFRRISSVFGTRKHPVLGTWRQHKGVDYAAGSGTPVRTVGDGVIAFSGWKSGYGNTVDVRHPNGYVTRYGHLKGFARGTRSGARVSIGTTIGFVGMTGLATGPHLHFEVLVKGVQRDPRVALRNKGGEPIPASERAAFQAIRERMLAQLDRPSILHELAQR